MSLWHNPYGESRVIDSFTMATVCGVTTKRNVYCYYILLGLVGLIIFQYRIRRYCCSVVAIMEDEDFEESMNKVNLISESNHHNIIIMFIAERKERKKKKCGCFDIFFRQHYKRFEFEE